MARIRDFLMAYGTDDCWCCAENMVKGKTYVLTIAVKGDNIEVMNLNCDKSETEYIQEIIQNFYEVLETY